MSTQIEQVPFYKVRNLISSGTLNEYDRSCLTRCSRVSTRLMVGVVDGLTVCVIGLIPPTLLSDWAYLWMHTTEHLCEVNNFVLIRRSQIIIEDALRTYPLIVGHCESHNHKAKKWLKWLGATFGSVTYNLIPFSFERKDG